MNYLKKQNEILQKIEKAKAQLEKLQVKRKEEIAEIAMKYQLHELTNKELDEHFKTIAISKGFYQEEDKVSDKAI